MKSNEERWGRARRGLPENWPAEADGTPERPERAARTQEGPMAGMTRNLLEAYGIPVLELVEPDGTFARVLMGASAYGAGLYVPASRLEEAKALLEGGEAEGRDAEGGDAEGGEAETAPPCGDEL